MTDPAPELVYFGDSLSDDGNLFDATAGVLPFFVRILLGGPTNAASDGVTHATYTADLTGLSTANYAVGAAESAGSYLLGEVIEDFGLSDLLIVPDDDPSLEFDINMGAQVDRFLGDTAGADLSGTTAMILIGGNDYGNLDPESPTLLADAVAAISGVMDGIENAAQDLAASGVGTIVISTLPPAEFFPEILASDPDEFANSELLFDAHNVALQALIGDLIGDGLNVELLDTGAMAAAIAEDPTGFGLIAPYELTQQDSDVLDDFDNDQVAFWDGVHPTTATHGVLGAHNAHYLDGGEIEILTDDADRAREGGADDLMLGYGGADTMKGGGGDDSGFGGTGQDRMRGQEGGDIASGGAGGDDIGGGGGADVLDGDGGDDLIQGNRGADVLIDGLGSDLALGGGGTDTFIFTQAELIGGTTGDDADVFDGGGGSDTLYMIVAEDQFDALSTGSLQDALDVLGITASNIETFVFVDGRDDLAAELGTEAWYQSADIWGLV